MSEKKLSRKNSKNSNLKGGKVFKRDLMNMTEKEMINLEIRVMIFLQIPLMTKLHLLRKRLNLFKIK
jgi:hypothetical protein